MNCGTSPIVPVYTTNDSAFYFDEGTIAAVYRIDSFYCVVTKTNSDEYITYSNLLSTPYKKGDRLQYGAYVGRLGKSDDDAMLNQLDILVMTQRSPEEIEKLKEYGKRRRIDEHKSLMYDECVRYILRKMKAECSSNSATAL
ncbi:MAG TPA: hypothetical protein VHM26_17330 [Chitinophagaceae bacterium]|nr:hypothetical protein [Chitinophagaceae bacterium]